MTTRALKLQSWINQNTDYSCEKLELISGDASFRRYFRFVNENQSIVAVDAPPEFEDCMKFVYAAKSFEEHGVQVPKVFEVDPEQGFYCQQDFGNHQFAQVIGAGANILDVEKWYQKGLQIIPYIQTCQATTMGSFPAYDAAFVDRELGIFSEWLLVEYLQLSLTPSQSEMLSHTFQFVSNGFLSQPVAGVHRDFHSRNLMILADNSIGVIDFQDAVVGPITYDAVSLLRDCYQVWPKTQTLAWLKQWQQEYYSQYEWLEFKAWFDICGIQRHIKIAGIFARLFLRDNKNVYLKHIPDALKYLIDVCAEYSELKPFAEFVEHILLPKVNQKLGNAIEN